MKKKIQPRPLARGQIRNYIYLSTICARKRCTRAHRSTIAQAFTSAQKSERMLGQALRPRWALTAICTYVSLPGLFGCVSSSAPLLSAMLFRAFSMTCGNPTWALFSPRCSLMNAPQRNGSWGASVPLYLQHVGRCGLVYFQYLKIPHTMS